MCRSWSHLNYPTAGCPPSVRSLLPIKDQGKSKQNLNDIFYWWHLTWESSQSWLLTRPKAVPPLADNERGCCHHAVIESMQMCIKSCSLLIFNFVLIDTKSPMYLIIKYIDDFLSINTNSNIWFDYTRFRIDRYKIINVCYIVMVRG